MFWLKTIWNKIKFILYRRFLRFWPQLLSPSAIIKRKNRMPMGLQNLLVCNNKHEEWSKWGSSTVIGNNLSSFTKTSIINLLGLVRNFLKQNHFCVQNTFYFDIMCTKTIHNIMLTSFLKCFEIRLQEHLKQWK